MRTPEILGYSPGSLEVFLFVFSLLLFLAASGIVESITIWKLNIKVPTTKKTKLLLLFLGSVLVVTSIIITLRKPTWTVVISRELIYSGLGEDAPKQIIVDGKFKYILTVRGNILKYSQGAAHIIDNGTGTKQIAAAGGLVYILKNNGEVWSVITVPLTKEINKFKEIDPGIGTRMMTVAGENIYVLKNDGTVFRIFTNFVEGKFVTEYTELPNISNIRQVVSSGAILFLVDYNSELKSFFAMQEAWHSDSKLTSEFNKKLQSCGKVDKVVIDGETPYFIAPNRKPYSCQDGIAKRLFDLSLVKEIDARDGLVFILTTSNEIWRFDTLTKSKMEYYANTEKSRGLEFHHLTASSHGCFVIDNLGRTWRFSESLRRQ